MAVFGSLRHLIVCNFPGAFLSFFFLVVAHAAPADAQVAEGNRGQTVYFAGYGFASAAADVSQRFPNISAALADSEFNFDRALYGDLADNRDFGSFQITGDEKGKLGEGSGALVLALVLDRETTSVSKVGDKFKVLATISFSAMIFDFDSSEVLSAVPLSLTYVDLVSSPPSPDYLEDLYLRLTTAENSRSVRSLFWQALGDTVVPSNGSRRLRVTKVALPNDVDWADQQALKIFGDDAAGALSRFISRHFRIATLPYSNSQAISGKMAERIGNGEVFNFRIPEEDYSIELSLDAFKKINTASNAVGSVFVYGVFATISVKEPLTQRTLFEGAYKHGETRTVPVSVNDAPDWAAFEAVTEILLEDLVKATGQVDKKWEKAHGAGKSHAAGNIAKFKEILDSCR